MRYDVGNIGEFEENDPYLDAAEYQVQCLAAKSVESERTGTKGTSLQLKVLAGPTQTNKSMAGRESVGMSFFTTLWLPHAGMKDGGAFARRTLRKAVEAFGVPFDATGFDSDGFLNKTAIVVTKVGKGQDDEPVTDIKAWKPLGVPAGTPQAAPGGGKAVNAPQGAKAATPAGTGSAIPQY